MLGQSLHAVAVNRSEVEPLPAHLEVPLQYKYSHLTAGANRVNPAGMPGEALWSLSMASIPESTGEGKDH